jgi:hypothetical protein
MKPEAIKDYYEDYIADRVNEMFNIVELTGKTFRQ